MDKYKMNQYVRDNHLLDYAGNVPSGNVVLDCSLGVNSKKLPDLIFTRLREFNNGPGEFDNEGDIKHYPHDESLLQRLTDYFKSKNVTWIEKNNIILGAGSYDILCNINMMCLTRGQSVLGHAPQFTAYVDHVVFSGSIYDYYQMTLEDNNYLFNAIRYIKTMSSEHSLFIVENPNNPTGQIISKSDIAKIARQAMKYNTFLVVDEAYGDYMDISNSAIKLIPENPNIIVTRTFSKGFGMAGMRLGYAITANSDICDTLTQFHKLERPFNCSGIARVLATAMLDSNVDMIESEEVEKNKTVIMKTIGGCKRLKYATTSERTPIITIYYTGDKEDLDLQKYFLDKVGLLTVNCSTYMGLNSRTVRVMLPMTEYIDILLKMIRDVDFKLVKEGY
jgi:histidinol-phosphate aminotransferase